MRPSDPLCPLEHVSQVPGERVALIQLSQAPHCLVDGGTICDGSPRALVRFDDAEQRGCEQSPVLQILLVFFHETAAYGQNFVEDLSRLHLASQGRNILQRI